MGREVEGRGELNEEGGGGGGGGRYAKKVKVETRKS